MSNITIVYKKLDDIIPYEKNPRKNDGAVDSVANSINEFGFKVPIVINKDSIIIAGHTRWKAAKKIGMDAVPCIVADDLTEEQVRAYRLADNKTGELAEWDLDALAEELAMIDLDMDDFGFDLRTDIEEDLAETIKEAHFNYKEQYGVIVICKDEKEQEAVYNRLAGEGYECKVVAV